jgi:hypothetical protein
VPEAEACDPPRLTDIPTDDRKVWCKDTLVAWRYGTLKDRDGLESFDDFEDDNYSDGLRRRAADHVGAEGGARTRLSKEAMERLWRRLE